MTYPGSQRLYVAYLLFIVAVMVAAVGFIVLVQRQQAIALQAQVHTVERTSEALAAHIEATVRSALTDEPTPRTVASLQTVLDGYKSAGDVFNIRISRTDRTVVAAVRRKNLEKPEALPLMHAALGGQPGTTYETVDNVRNFCVALPIRVGGSQWGAVVLYRDLEPTYETVRVAHERVLWVAGATFAVLLASISGLLWLAAREVRRARQAQARRARLALMGTMAAGVAHEIRNPLNSLALSIEYLRRRTHNGDAGPGLPPNFQEDLSSMQHEVQRLDQVVRDFGDLSKEPRIEPRRMPLSASVEHVAKLFQPIAQQRGITLQVRLEDGYAAVNIDPQRMEQVLINLVKNAIEATPAQGKVEIRTKVQDAQLVVEVTDSGAGIAADHQALIFEPFHSTRSHGLGLGLFLSKRLVEAHRGTLTMTSSAGAGTTFRISLPLPVPASAGAPTATS